MIKHLHKLAKLSFVFSWSTCLFEKLYQTLTVVFEDSTSLRFSVFGNVIKHSCECLTHCFCALPRARGFAQRQPRFGHTYVILSCHCNLCFLPRVALVTRHAPQPFPAIVDVECSDARAVHVIIECYAGSSAVGTLKRYLGKVSLTTREGRFYVHILTWSKQEVHKVISHFSFNLQMSFHKVECSF